MRHIICSSSHKELGSSMTIHSSGSLYNLKMYEVMGRTCIYVVLTRLCNLPETCSIVGYSYMLILSISLILVNKCYF